MGREVGVGKPILLFRLGSQATLGRGQNTPGLVVAVLASSMVHRQLRQILGQQLSLLSSRI
jgi:hypothetical protein